MRFRLSLTFLFKCQQVITIICFIPLIWGVVFSYIYLPSTEFTITVLPTFLVPLVLYLILLALCYKRLAIAFFYSLVIFIYPFFLSYESGFRITEFFQLNIQPQMIMLGYILSIIISLIGIVITVQEYFKR